MKIVKYYAISEIEDSYQLHRTTKKNQTETVQQLLLCFYKESNNQRHVTHSSQIMYNTHKR